MTREEVLERAREAMLGMRFDEALQWYDELLRHDRSDADGLYLKGQAMTNLGRFDEALALFDRALKATAGDPARHADVLIDKGNSLIETQRLDEAEECYDAALRIKPRVGQAWVEKARVAYRRGKYDLSAAHADRAIALDPADARAWNNKGHALLRLGRVNDSIQAAQRALELKPDYTGAWACLQLAYQQQGKTDLVRTCGRRLAECAQSGMVFETRGHLPVAMEGRGKEEWLFWKRRKKFWQIWR
jgi:tetratricopeptide (TPR) repeat protein